MRIRAITLRVACVVLAFGVAACAKKSPESAAGEDPVLARVGSVEIRDSDLQSAYNGLSAGVRSQYAGPAGQQRLLDELIDSKLLVIAAEELKLDERPVVRDRLQHFREQTLIQAYTDYLQENLPQPTEQDLMKYFEDHASEFRMQARVNASWIRCATRAEIDTARRRIVADGKRFADVAREVSTDQCSKQDGGLLGYFNPEGYVRCIGNNPAFQKIVFALEEGDVSQPFEWEGGWAIVVVHEKSTARDLPFAKVRERVALAMRPRLTPEAVAADRARLRQEFKVQRLFKLEDALADRTADDLMLMATEASNPQDKLSLFGLLIDRYPDYQRADEVRFMMGFTYSEELKDLAAARREFERVIEDYPNSEIRESAVYMLENLGQKDLPRFEQPAPETAP